MRRLMLAFSALALATSVVVPTEALAQSRGKPEAEKPSDKEKKKKEWDLVQRPLKDRPNAGPCPYVKVLYDAARYIEFEGGREASAAVGFTSEIEGVKAECEYREDEPIKVEMELLFAVGRGPKAEGLQKTYRYWVAVTDRNKSVLAKEYFDLPVAFEEGADRTYVRERIDGIVIPRAEATTSGSNFEILVGMDVTTEMASFNRAGKRFRINAGQSQTAQTQGQGQAQQ